MILFIDSKHDTDDNKYWFFGPGFYFVDEVEQLNGPYKTPEEAKKALDLYVEQHLS